MAEPRCLNQQSCDTIFLFSSVSHNKYSISCKMFKRLKTWNLDYVRRFQQNKKGMQTHYFVLYIVSMTREFLLKFKQFFDGFKNTDFIEEN